MIRSIRLLCSLAILVGLSVVSGCASLVTPNYTQELTELRSGQYVLDPEHTYIHFRIEHLGLSTIVGRFNSADAVLDFDPLDTASLNLEGFVDVASIDLNNRDLEDRLRGVDWFNTDRFPQASFTTQSVTPQSANTFLIQGSFDLRGIEKPMTLEATFKGGADNLLTGKYTLGFAANSSFLRSDYEIDGFGALLADEVFIEIHAEFQKSD